MTDHISQIIKVGSLPAIARRSGEAGVVSPKRNKEKILRELCAFAVRNKQAFRKLYVSSEAPQNGMQARV
jgi:hypothetical protein